MVIDEFVHHKKTEDEIAIKQAETTSKSKIMIDTSFYTNDI